MPGLIHHQSDTSAHATRVASATRTAQEDRRPARAIGGNLLIHPMAGASGTATIEPNPYPIKKYVNPHHLCYHHRTDQAWTFVTMLVPFEDDRVPKVSVAPLVVESDGHELSEPHRPHRADLVQPPQHRSTRQGLGNVTIPQAGLPPPEGCTQRPTGRIRRQW